MAENNGPMTPTVTSSKQVQGVTDRLRDLEQDTSPHQLHASKGTLNPQHRRGLRRASRRRPFTVLLSTVVTSNSPLGEPLQPHHQ
jgi:3-methyladenine DNA glycosylase/8-oxoguanine DNA glycosylase